MVSSEQSRSGTPAAFGQTLRSLREDAGIELEDIVAETKVPRQTYARIEAGQFSGLPEKVFCRNFLRQYIAIVGGDEDELMGRFDEAWDRFLLASGTFTAMPPEPVEPTRAIRWWFWLPVILAILVIVTLIGLMVRGARPIDQDLRPDPRRSSAADLETGIARSSPTPEFLTQLDPTAVPEEPAASRRVTAIVRVDENAECWLRYRDGSGATGQELLDGGESWRLDLEGPVLLTLGNAAAASLEFGGEVHDELGRPGQVIHLRLTADGMLSDGRSPDHG